MLVGKADTIALLVNPSLQAAETQLADAQKAALTLGVKLFVSTAHRENELVSAFTALAQNKVDVLLVGADPFFGSQRSRIVELAARYRIPTIYPQRNFVEAGGLLSYGASLEDSYRQVGVYVGRILKGQKPSELPVLQPIKFDLVINLKTAKALGLEIPPMLLALADEVVE